MSNINLYNLNPATPAKATLAEFRAAYPQFSMVPDPEVQFALDIAGELLGISKLGQLAAAAHILEVERTNTHGILAEEQIGPKRIRYQTLTQDNSLDFFKSTRYGLLYLELDKYVTGISARVW